MTQVTSIDASAFHRESIIIDTVSVAITKYGERQERSGVTAAQVTVPYADDTFEQAVHYINEYYDLAHRDRRFEIVTDVAQIPKLKADGRMGIVIAFQGADPIGNRLDLADAFHRLGVRVVQLTYNDRNLVADGCCEKANGGLSRFGRSLVKRFNQLGIVVDLSHVGERSSLEAIEASARPCMFSHSNPKALFPTPRNISDEQMKAVAAGGGVVGICCYPILCWDYTPRRPSLQDLLHAMDYAIELIGPDHVAFGTDQFGTEGWDASAWDRHARPEISDPYHHQFGGVDEEVFLDGFAGLIDVPKLTAALLEHGYPPNDVRKILGENMLRLYKQIWT